MAERLSFFHSFVVSTSNAGVAELADALDSKSTAMLGERSAVAVSLPMATKARPASVAVFSGKQSDNCRLCLSGWGVNGAKRRAKRQLNRLAQALTYGIPLGVF
jgi:hypothetical protein